MTSLIKPSLGAAALLLAALSPVAAEDLPQEQYVLDLGAGIMAKPRYPGSDEVIFDPFPIIAVGRLYVPGLGQVIDGEDDVNRFSLYPSFDFNGKRESSDSNELEGMKDVDWALELGLGAAYRHDWIRGFVEMRQGFNGHSGQVADIGLDFIANPTEDLEVMVGPRARWGSEDYMETYFGITSKEAAASPNFDSEYDAGAGFSSVGIAATASYDLTEELTFHLQGGWDRLIGDAADSPLVKDGSEDQLYAGAGLSYQFSFSLD